MKFNKIKIVPCAIADSLLNKIKGTLSVKRERLSLQVHASVLGVIVRRKTPSLIRSTRYFFLEMKKIIRSNGLSFGIKYLKACSVLLMQSSSGMKIPSTRPLGVAVSRTSTGLPRIIPSEIRKRIRQDDKIALRVWLTLFSIYRVIQIPSKVSLSTITDLGPDLVSRIPTFKRLATSFWRLCPYTGLRLTQMRVTPFLISKSSSTSKWTGNSQTSTSVYSLIRSAHLYFSSGLVDLFYSACGCFKACVLPSLMTKWLMGLRSNYILANIEEPTLGRLGFKQEAAGKVRVFAMVDPWLNWLLKPFHDALFDHIRKWSTDGTFDQLAPIYRLQEKGYTRFWCYDLSAATDRLPLLLQVELLRPVFGRWADRWGELLVNRDYWYPKDKSLGISDSGRVRYSVGQPMGALSSWAMLALTHHFIVQWAYWASRPRLTGGLLVIDKFFKGYAVLGDDIVIADGKVAREYVKIMTMLGVKIGLAKSLVSRKGSLEFAKRFFVSGVDCSPLPYKEYVAARASIGASLELKKKYSLSWASLIRARGYGFRVLGSLSKPIFKLSPKIRNLLLVDRYDPNDLISWFKLGLDTISNWDLAVKAYLKSEAKALDSKMLSLTQRLCLLSEAIYPVYIPSAGPRSPSSIDQVTDFRPEFIYKELPQSTFSDIASRLYEPGYHRAHSQILELMTKIESWKFEAFSTVNTPEQPWLALSKTWLTSQVLRKEMDLIVIPDFRQAKVEVDSSLRSSVRLAHGWWKVVSALRTPYSQDSEVCTSKENGDFLD